MSRWSSMPRPMKGSSEGPGGRAAMRLSRPFADGVAVLAPLARRAVVVRVAGVEAHVVLATHVRRAVVVAVAGEGAHSAVAVVVVLAAKALAVRVAVTKRAGQTLATPLGLEATDLVVVDAGADDHAQGESHE